MVFLLLFTAVSVVARGFGVKLDRERRAAGMMNANNFFITDGFNDEEISAKVEGGPAPDMRHGLDPAISQLVIDLLI
jgi:hypothetical protein